MGARDLRLPWQPLDPDGDGILARVVHDAGLEHVAVFESAGAARAACDAMNRGEGRESELREATGELERVRAELAIAADPYANAREVELRARIDGLREALELGRTRIKELEAKLLEALR